MDPKEEWNKAIENGSEAMIQALNTFGPSETLSLLLCFSNDDPVVNHLLIKHPSVVAIGEFLSRMLVCKNRNNKVKGKIKVKRVNDGKRKAKNEESFTPGGVVKEENLGSGLAF